ncbi:C2H2 type zinc-finger-domain-containing protein [Mycotypha africana]|uniref:C2H2 type zinc-finger-domain-containing protein n=1 Tax=Mycotypha africana TaxID=64632 RepID=UPI0023003BF0|nr:C2H2 type zinc-finger-domain-containing protein [Mycotypha africana]KAI8971555.1 C2H2 type zinc-finger-domain-containing protein [Mycotypha africana]
MAVQETTSNYSPSSGLYTCLACQVAFQSAEGQRNHYRSDWHRYNLKRKVVNLPPVTLEQFNAKSEARAKQATATTIATTGTATGSTIASSGTAAESVKENNNYCKACRKSFRSTHQYDNHIQSKKHKDTVAKEAAKASKENNSSTPVSDKEKKPQLTSRELAQQMDLTITDETTEEEMLAMIDAKIKSAPRLAETDCLFCTTQSDTFEENMQHMTTVHSLFIPDIEYLMDMRGLIRYLGEKITVGNVCIYCNNKGRGTMRSVEAVRKHMIDKGHCKIAYEDDDDAAELVDFYDFSSSYPQGQEGDEEEVDIDADLEQMTAALSLADDELSLVLPSGAVVGHRAMKRYYDQKLKPEDNRDSVLINKLIGQYSESPVFESLRKTSGGPKGSKLMITDGRHGMRPTEAFKDLRNQHEYTTKVGMNQNRLQKHFRIQII